jgi:hypothetical protein
LTTSAAHEDQCSSRSHFVGRVARDVKCQQEVIADNIANLFEVHISATSVVRSTGCHHHVVDYREVPEEPIESNRIPGVESRSTQGINLTGGMPEALGIPAREDHLGPFGPCTTRRFQSNAGATADHNNGLPKKLRFRVGGEGTVTVLIFPPIRTATRRGYTLALAVTVRHCVQVGWSELEAMSALAGARLRAGDALNWPIVMPARL